MEGIRRFLFKQALGTTNNKGQRFINWDQVKRLALVVSAPMKGAKSELDKWIVGTDKQIDVYYIETGVKQASYSDWQCLTKVSATWLGMPNAACLQSLSSRKYDVLICLSPQINYFEQRIALQIEAGLKVWCRNDIPFYALCIDRAQNSEVAYLEHCVKYLKMIRN